MISPRSRCDHERREDRPNARAAPPAVCRVPRRDRSETAVQPPPRPRRTPRRGHRRHGLVVAAVGPGVGAEEADVVADPVQRGQRLPHPAVGDVPLAVEGEGVDAEPLARGPRLDAGQRDPADGELAQQLEQRAGAVADHGEQGGLVVAGRGGQLPGRADQDEPGDRAGPVGQVADERHQPVALGGDRRADGGVVLALSDGLGCSRRRRQRQRGHAREDLRQPPGGLREGVRMTGHRADVGRATCPAGRRARTRRGGTPRG